MLVPVRGSRGRGGTAPPGRPRAAPSRCSGVPGGVRAAVRAACTAWLARGQQAARASCCCATAAAVAEVDSAPSARARGACRRRRRGGEVPRRSYWRRRRRSSKRVGSVVRPVRRAIALIRAIEKNIEIGDVFAAHLDARGGGACDAAARNLRGGTRSCAFGRVSREIDSAHRREGKWADTNANFGFDAKKRVWSVASKKPSFGGNRVGHDEPAGPPSWICVHVSRAVEKARSEFCRVIPRTRGTLPAHHSAAREGCSNT